MSRAAAWIAFAIAFLLVFFDLIDRQILAALFPYIKAEWSLADTQIGSLVTIVNVSIAALVVPSGILVDRWSRKKVLGLMGAVWSIATGLCAFAGQDAAAGRHRPRRRRVSVAFPGQGKAMRVKDSFCHLCGMLHSVKSLTKAWRKLIKSRAREKRRGFPKSAAWPDAAFTLCAGCP